MVNKKLTKSHAYGILGIVIFNMLFLTLLSSANADSTTLYLDWKLENNNSVFGHLTLDNFPSIMEKNITYRIEVILTLDSGDQQDLGYLNFKAYNSEDQTGITLGYSYLNATLNKADSVTLVSHWKYTVSHNLTEMNLVVESEKGNFILSPEQNVIKFPLMNTLSISVPEKVSRDDILSVTGSMHPSNQGLKITLTYVQPNGSEIVRRTIVDGNGLFTDNIKPDLEGTWWVKANFNATQNYAKSSTELLSFKVEPLMPYWILIAIFIFIIWLFVTLYCYNYKPVEKTIIEKKSDNN